MLTPIAIVSMVTLSSIGLYGHYRWEQLYDKALALHRQGRNAEGCEIAEAALKNAKIFGPNFPNMGVSMAILAMCYRDMGKYDDAEPLSKRALEITEKLHGPKHRDTAMALYSLAKIYRLQKRYSEADFFYKRALDILDIDEESPGPDNSRLATVLEDMAKLYRDMGKEDEAKRMDERAKKILDVSVQPCHAPC